MTQTTVGPVMAAHYWKSNAELILDAYRLGYLKVKDRVLDPTFGEGVWWKEWKPKTLVAPTDFYWDFRNMDRFGDGEFDCVAFDPPYVSMGGRKTTGMPEFFRRYGLTDAAKSPAGVQQVINDGLAECARVTRRHVLVKCQSYVSSGKFWPGELHTMNHAYSLGLTLEDRFIHLRIPTPQDETRRQVHARNNCSTLFVFRKAK